MALLNAKSLENAKLEAMLVAAEQAKTEALLNLEQELTEVRQTLIKEKAAKQSAQSDCDFFRDQYGRASAFVSSVRKENVELEERARIAEEQAKTGVELVKATFTQRVAWLEDDARTWRWTAQHLMEMDKRTKGEELRKRAGEAPELRKKCDDLEEKNEMLSERLEELEDELDAKVQEEQVKRALEEQQLQARNESELARQAELERWRQETLRLNVELNEVKTEKDKMKVELAGVKAELERVTGDAGAGKVVSAQASPSDLEMVYRCQWRPEGSNDACEGLFLSVEVCFVISSSCP
jgi:hypothetical protein